MGTNDAFYKVVEKEFVFVDGKRKQVTVWTCPYYNTWGNMLCRCYSASFKRRSPTYEGCIVHEDWHLFSDFKAWMETQDWEGKQLDKDILVEGNKVYSPETCVFVSQSLNSFMLEGANSTNKYPIGVTWCKTKQKFKARCCNPFTGKDDSLGYHNCPQKAHEAWKARKAELAQEYINTLTDTRIMDALRRRFIG